jgi:hypothetical protein
MRILKPLFYLLLFTFTLFLPVANPSGVFSQVKEEKSVVVVNPIRGRDFWSNSFDLLQTPKSQYEIISKNNLSATWLLRHDALKDQNVTQYLKSLNKSQELGIFLEITPSLTTDAKVKYNESPNWHYAKSLLVIGYSPEDRRKLIDTVFNKFKENFGYFPKSVGAWWIDAGSLSYIREKYGIEANLDVSDQFSTDQYQVWGQYWSVPFYPSKFNALMPAQNKENKIGTVTLQWAPRDPFNGYGNGVFESTFSVQANDYILHELDINYFKKLLSIYPQVTLGLENDFSWDKFGREYTKQIEEIAKQKNQGSLTVSTMGHYASTYQKLFPDISPNVLISADDPLGTSGKVVWYQTPRYRVGWFFGPYGSVIRDLRELKDGVEEVCLKKACEKLNLSFTPGQAVDDINFSSRWVLDEGTIDEYKVTSSENEVTLSYKNQSGTKRQLKFLPNDIQLDEKIQPISTAILNVISQPQNVSKVHGDLESRFSWSENLKSITINLLKFIFLILIFFFLPGWVISRNWFLSIPVGWVIFTLLGFVLGYANLEFLIWLLPIACVIFLQRYKKLYPSVFRKAFLEEKLKALKNPRMFLLILLIVLGSITWLLTQVKNGLLYNFGYGYWGPSGHDAIWHLSLISELQRSIPPQNPIFAGEALNNYHYFFDLLLALSGKLFSIDNQELLFRHFPLLISVFSGILIYKVVKSIAYFLKKDDNFAFYSGLFSVFFLYFGGSFGWVVSLFREKNFGGETMFWAQQSISTLINPPFALSVVIFLSGLYLFYEFLNNKGKNWLNISLISLLWGSLIEFKAYAGVLVLASLFLVTLERVILKRDFRLLPIFIGSLLISLLVFFPNNLGSTSLFVFSPLWIVYSMILFPDRLGWYRLNLAAESGVGYKVFLASAIGVGIYLLGNLGTRVLSIFAFKEIFSLRLLLYIALFGTLIPLLFIQKGTNWNSIQFFYYSLLIFDIFASFTLAKIFTRSKRLLGAVIVAVTILLTIPTSLDTLKHYLPPRPPSRLSRAEIEGLKFLNKEPNGTVLTLAFDPKAKDKYGAPVPLYAYTSTAYVSAFANKPVFLEDMINLEILGIDYKGRVNLLRDFAKIPDQSKRILKENNISYVYIVKASNFQEDESKMGILKIFENAEVSIYKVN